MSESSRVTGAAEVLRVAGVAECLGTVCVVETAEVQRVAGAA